MKYLSCVDIFQEQCNKLTQNIDLEDIVNANKFISLAARIGKNYPFVFLPDFLEDFVNGVFTKKLLDKYDLPSLTYDYLIKYVMKMPRSRSKDPNKNNLEINLQNIKIEQMYTLVLSQKSIFNVPLTNMLNCNILRALLAYAILEYGYISNDDLSKKVRVTYDKIKDDIHILSNNIRRNSFENYINDGLDSKLYDIIRCMGSEALITHLNGDIALPNDYSNISNRIYRILEEKNKGISCGNLHSKILNELPLFKITVKGQVLENILKDMEHNHKIVRIPAFWKYAPDSDQLFTSENYVLEREKVRKQVIDAGRIKFFGRNIKPDQFISELKTLETGDLDDLDDQVTRMAGLVLSDTVFLQSPRENMNEFDFLVDITNYKFRPEQNELMKKIDFHATASTFHCKVMINDKVTDATLSKLKKVIPKDEQGVIFTCKPVSLEILQETKNDRTIQIINEDGIRDWCSITPIIPCRRHSVARVMYGDGIGKTVLVKSLNYESGLAVVETIPNRIETTFPIGCLKEIDLRVSDPNDFETASDTYVDFLCMLADSSGDIFDDGMNANIINVHTRHIDLMRSIHPELFEGPHPQIDHMKTESKHDRYIEFENNLYTKISQSPYDHSFTCKCSHNLNEEHYRTFCKHLVASINKLCIGETYDWYEINKNIDMFRTKLEKFEEENLSRMIFAIHDVLVDEDKPLFEEYLSKYIDTD